MQKSFMEIFNNILGSIREPLLMLDSDLKVVRANHSFYQTFNVKPDETVGALIYDLGDRQWDIPALRKLLKEKADVAVDVLRSEIASATRREAETAASD